MRVSGWVEELCSRNMPTSESSATSRGDGHVYILSSPRCEYIKIGGTDHAPIKRIKEINVTEPYKGLGPWSLHDFRQVTDWRKVEHSLHYVFRSAQVTTIAGQKELFAVAPATASSHLAQIEETLIVRKPRVDRMFQDHEFSNFLFKLFEITGLMNWLDQQGAWTFSLFPSTSGGRYYTLNIGSHEVAFATSKCHGQLPIHMFLMDRLVLDFPHINDWLKARDGEIHHDQYETALERATSVFFQGDFDTAVEFLNLAGVRRAMLAYWTEALIGLQERGISSVYSRFHNWNAVAELRNRLLSIEN